MFTYYTYVYFFVKGFCSGLPASAMVASTLLNDRISHRYKNLFQIRDQIGFPLAKIKSLGGMYLNATTSGSPLKYRKHSVDIPQILKSLHFRSNYDRRVIEMFKWQVIRGCFSLQNCMPLVFYRPGTFHRTCINSSDFPIGDIKIPSTKF